MARILGAPGRYVSDEAGRQRQQLLISVCVMIGLLGVIQGIVVSIYIPLSWLTGAGRAAILLAASIGIWAIDKWGNKRIDANIKKQKNMARGASGEIRVGDVLKKLSDEFCVINDLSTSTGNIDHVVIGPTGVFALDAKSWRGIISADGKGHLLWNGKPTEKSVASQFVARVLGTKDKIRALAPDINAYYTAVFVFTAAWVEATWNKTGNVICVTDEQLCKYIENKYCQRRLKPQEVNRIAQAFSGLAHMDKDFERPAPQPQILSQAPVEDAHTKVQV